MGTGDTWSWSGADTATKKAVDSLKWKWKMSLILNLLFCVFLSFCSLIPALAGIRTANWDEWVTWWLTLLVLTFPCLWLIDFECWGDLQALVWSLFIKACFQEITGICEIPLVKCIWSKYFLDPHRAGPVIMSSLMSPGAHRCLGQPEELCYCLQTELASCFQKVVVIPWSPLAVSFYVFHLFIFLELYKFVN